jgi:hypothetical protein
MKRWMILMIAVASLLPLTGCFKTVSPASLEGETEEFVSMIPEGVIGSFEGSFDAGTKNVAGRVEGAVRGKDFVYTDVLTLRTDGLTTNLNVKLTDYYRGNIENAALVYALIRRLEQARDDPVDETGEEVAKKP